MKGLILCAGKGTRLRPITYTNAKQLIPVANKPVIHYSLQAMADADIRDVGIVVGETGREIKDYVGAGEKWGLRVTYIYQDVPKGIAHAVQKSVDFIAGDTFVLYLGDNLIREGVKGLVEKFRKEKPNALILLTRVSNPSAFGVAELDGNRIISLEEKPKKPKSNLAVVGVYLFDKNILDAVFQVKPSWRGELEITDAISLLLKQGLEVKAHIIKGFWKDTGVKEDILEANRMFLEELKQDVQGKVDAKSDIKGRVRIEQDVEIIESKIQGPVIIGARSRIINSYVGPFTSIDEDVLIEKSEVENSIILRGSKIISLGARLEESIVGRDVEIKKVNFRPYSYKMMLGDCSKVDVL